jgi:LmbE family N-acetylglucosaminyl deacetylase
MKSLLHPDRLLLALLLAATLTLPAQQLPAQQLQDPANLTGEQVSPQDPADTLPINHGALALQQLLRKLRTRASFMLIVAHPDDEDNGMLTYLSRGQGARVAMLTLNRGEGGQNLMSADFDDALGLIRTQELLAADRYMAVDQFFGTEVDFGFSKTKEEAFAKWTHERVLYDAVRCVRLYRPLVIASVFIGGPSDGHGQHQVSGQIAQEVFNAAGDPTVFPDQIAAGLQPWQPLKVYARAPFGRIDAQGIYDSATGQYAPARFTNYVTGKVTTTPPRANVLVPEGNTDPLLGGVSYAEFGREGRSLQRSQFGGGGGRGGGGSDVAYHRYGSHITLPDGKGGFTPQLDGDDDGIDPSFFSDIDTSIEGIATLIPNASASLRASLRVIDESIANAQHAFNPAHPEACAPSLREALVVLDLLIKDSASINAPAAQKASLLHELRIKRVQLNNAIILALGITLKATLSDPASAQNIPTTQTSLSVSLKTSYSGNASAIVRIDGVAVNAPTGITAIKAPTTGKLDAPTPNIAALNLNAPHGLPPTRPYFSRANTEQPTYDIVDPSLRNAPTAPAPFIATATLSDNGVPLTIKSTVATLPTDTIPSQPIVVVPPASVTFSRPNGILPLDRKDPTIWVESRIPAGKCLSYTADIIPPECSKYADETEVKLKFPSNWRVEKPTTEAPIAKDGMLTQYIPFDVVPPPLHSGESINATAVATWKGHEYSEGYRTVGYPGLPATNFFTPAIFRTTAVDVKVPPRLRVAYISGTGDDVLAYLYELDIHAQTLTLADLTPTTLAPYDAVILGVRAYAAHPELAGPSSRALLDYANNGGVVLVQYMTARFGDAEAPFPISVPGDPAHNVVDEAQPVTLLAPDSPLLTWPNRITPADFDHWIEERGHGFAVTWAPQFTPLLEVHDPGQPPQQGGLLVARTGKGLYIYCALALYRQLPEGVPGAYRLLANLISAAKNPTLSGQSTPSAIPAPAR